MRLSKAIEKNSLKIEGLKGEYYLYFKYFQGDITRVISELSKSLSYLRIVG